MDQSKIKELKSFVSALKSDPQLIYLSDLKFFKEYVESLGGSFSPKAARDEVHEIDDPERMHAEKDDFPPEPSVNELSDSAQEKWNELKSLAQDAIEDGDRLRALSLLNEAVAMGGATAMLVTKRAELLLKLKRPMAAIKDCDFALSLNPDSGKAFRVRGTAYRFVHEWEKAHADLANAQRIDFDDATEAIKRFVDEQFKESGKIKSSSSRAAPSSPPKRESRAGMPAGMEGMFAQLLSDPELISAMSNPRVMQAVQEMMTNPGALFQYQNDPEVGPVLMKLMSKLGSTV
jgi:suppressor of tumorigenicity protein 13